MPFVVVGLSYPWGPEPEVVVSSYEAFSLGRIRALVESIVVLKMVCSCSAAGWGRPFRKLLGRFGNIFSNNSSLGTPRVTYMC